MRHKACSVRVQWLLALVSALALAADTFTQAPAGGAPAKSASRATLQQFEQWMTTFSNHGRWGSTDELGALNLITPAKRRAAAALVKTGDVVSLAHPLLTQKAADVQSPFTVMPRIQEANGYALDREEIDFHGYAFSHLDALCHVSYKGKLYNGYDFKESVNAKIGCAKLGIFNARDKVVTRGVLIDIPRLRGVPYLQPGTRVYREDIEAWEKKAGMKVSPGDALFLRTGRWARRAKEGAFTNFAGWDPSVIPFFKERDIALLGGDGAHEAGTGPGDFPVGFPIHTFAIVALGAHLFDNLDLEALAETATKLNRWEFMLVAGPTPVPNGTGSPVNPIAIF